MTVYSKIPEISISNAYDLNIQKRKLSYYKVINGFFTKIYSEKKHEDLVNNLVIFTNLNYKKAYSLIDLIEKQGFVLSFMNRYDKMLVLDNSFPKYIKNLQRRIKNFEKKHHYVFGVGEYPLETKTEEVNEDVTK